MRPAPNLVGSASAIGATAAPVDLSIPQPVEVYLRRALLENRTVRAARYNLLAIRNRIPQVTALEDPVLSNSIWPFPSNAPQYSLMGYMPWDVMLAQQFPWLGTLRLRGCAAAEDAKVALAELATAELDVVANVKKAYLDLYYAQRATAILSENRSLAVEFLEIARGLYANGGAARQDVIRAEVAVADVDRELIVARQGLATARAELAEQLHVDPETEFKTLDDLSIGRAPERIEGLYRLAATAKPELRGRLAAVARDQKAVALALKRYYPNVTLGFAYNQMEKTNAATPRTASGMPNVGFFVGLTLPIYYKKMDAAVREAQARAHADGMLYEAERDATFREIKDAMIQTRAQGDTLALFREIILPKSEQALKSAASDYQNGNVDYLTLITAFREVLQIRLLIAQTETELGKSLASLERAAGVYLDAARVDSRPAGRKPEDAPRDAEIDPKPLNPRAPASEKEKSGDQEKEKKAR